MRGAAPAGPGVLESLAVHAQRRPNALALCSVSDSGAQVDAWTFARLHDAVTDMSRALERGGARVSIRRSDNSPESVAWMLAALRAGCVGVVIHPLASAREEGEAAQRCAGADIGGGGSLVLMSSGTTGLPKLAQRDAESLGADGRNLALAAGLSADDRVLAAVPLAHSYGVDLVMAVVTAGASLHIRRGGFDGGALQRYLAGGGVSVVPGVPLMFDALARAGNEPPRGVRLAFSAGSPLAAGVRGATERHWGIRLGHLYGATELGTVTFGDPADPAFRVESVGHALDGVSVRVVDPSDPWMERAPGMQGELAISAPSMTRGYIDGPAPLVDGHFMTGDLGWVDQARRVYVTGRLKHLIDVGGFKVNPAEVEAAFLEHAAIADCAIAPLVMSETITKLRLLYIPREGRGAPSEEELRAFARDRLARYKIPRQFRVVASIPRSASGKLLRHLLSEL